MSYEFDRYGRPIGRAIGGAMDAIGGLFSRDPSTQNMVDAEKATRMMSLPDGHPVKEQWKAQQAADIAPDIRGRKEGGGGGFPSPISGTGPTQIPLGVPSPSPQPLDARQYRPQPQQPITNQLPRTGGASSPMPLGVGVNQAITANRQPPQLPPPRRTPSKWDLMKEGMFAGEDQRGLFGKAGGDRGSMGLGGFFGDLFNNPNRMAMLSGGLTALDPGSYYDKEGFQSPWTGLRSGLGGAQAGYKSVIDRRKAEAETALAKAKTAAEGEDVSKWKHAPLGDAALLYSNKEINRERNRLMRQDPTLSITEANQQAVENTSIRKEKGIPKKSMFEIKKAFTSGQGQLAQIDILEGYAQDAFNAGWAGMGKRAWDAIKGAASIDTDTTESTKLVNGINQLVAQNWKDIVGSGPLSKGDKEFIDLVIKSPKSVFTTASEIRSSLSRLKRILRESQGRRAETIGVDYDPSAGPAPTLSGGDDIDALIKEFE